MKKVLSVGQCVPDHSTLCNYFENSFDCQVIKIDSTDEALKELRKNSYDLVLVNRKLDIDYTDGTILISEMQKENELRQIPVMLISNYEEYQREAIELGAVRGFGKLEYGKDSAYEKVAKFLPPKKIHV
ncbi:MAG TPA: response regulator [Leptospiraceae bacterium]|nr:response regulator [Leptospiraceae bacterium]HMW07289.1 response regulator [Leptospiraceae bacterium]HMX33756.1 response regulator [Leptospiraceae bacterium]HMY32893.1 response regulator [Leptospiraceae bacterium]HMZ65944.1 response regulator [Leptospiraceae bacterium]